MIVVEAGWYYVEGDPPGTARRWNGEQWIGFPIPDPSVPVGMHGGGHKRFRLTQGAQILSVSTMVVLVGLAAIFAFVASRILGSVDNLGPGAEARGFPSTRVVRIRDLDDYIPHLGLMFVAIAVGVIVAAFLFIAWIRTAAVVAQIHRFHSGSRPSRIERSAWLMVLQLVFFGIFAVTWWLLQAAVAGVASAAGSNKGLFGVVSDTAMAASTDPRTGIAQIGPLRLMVWWALWWGPAMVGVLTWGSVWVASPVSATTMQNAVRFSGILVGLEVISLLCIIVTIGQITARLSR